MKIAEAFVEVRPKTDGFQAETERGIAGPMKKLAVGVGAAFAVAGATQFLSGAIGEAREAAKITRLTEAAIRSTGSAAKVTADDVGELSERLSNMAGVDDELVQSANNVLLTFTKVRNEAGKGNKIFDQAALAALNMSAALGTDLQGATVMLGKALNDPIQGITAMTRAGVQFTQQQKDQIKAMIEAGDVLGAQKVILGELETQFGGAAKAAADPAAKLSVAWGNVQEQLGTFLLPIITKVSTALVEHKNLIGPLAALIGGLLVAATVAWGVSLFTAGGALAFLLSPITLVVAGVAALAAGIIYAYGHFDIFRSAVDAVGKVFLWVIDRVKDLVDWIGKLPGIIDKALGPIDELLGAVPGFLTGGPAPGYQEERRRTLGPLDPSNKFAGPSGGAVTVNISGADFTLADAVDVGARTAGWRLGGMGRR